MARQYTLQKCIPLERATGYHCYFFGLLQGEDDGTTLVPVAQYLEGRDGEKPLGVYALYDSNRNLQYVGYGRNIVLAVKVECSHDRYTEQDSRKRPAAREDWQGQAWLQLCSVQLILDQHTFTRQTFFVILSLCLRGADHVLSKAEGNRTAAARL